ncbi:MAG: GIN domain-containing protein [Chloroflexota bacterium]
MALRGLLILFWVVLVAGCARTGATAKSTAPSGAVLAAVERSVEVDAFTDLTIDGSVTLTLRTGHGPSLTIRGAADRVAAASIHQEGLDLTLHVPATTNAGAPSVEVEAATGVLSRIRVSHGATLVLNGIRAHDLRLEAASGSTVVGSGRIVDLDLAVSASTANIGEVSIGSGTVELTADGVAEVAVKGSLSGSVSDGGRLVLWATPTDLRVDAVDSGRIEPVSGRPGVPQTG